MAVQNVADVRLVIERHRAQIRALGVSMLGLFGSFVRGEQRPNSDVDVLVDFERGRKTFDNFIELAFLLEELLQRPVELVTPEAISPYIRPCIESEVEYVSLVP